jgi:hypothetical protein
MQAAETTRAGAPGATLRAALLAVSIAVAIAYADHVRQSTGVNWPARSSLRRS